MINHWFNALSSALGGGMTLALTASFGWGLLSILLSPCHLAGIPLIIGYISGRSNRRIKQSTLIAFLFSLGTLLTIGVIGLVTASMGRLLGDAGVFGNYFVAGIFFIVGFYLMDILPIPWDGFGLQQSNRGGLKGAFILGLLFGVGLGPCTFAYMAPVLGVVFQTSATEPVKALFMISLFGIGQSAVITLSGSLTGMVEKYLNWTDRSSVNIWIKRVAGFLVILGGVYYVYAA